MSLLFISGCAKDISFEESRRCNSSDECVVVEGRKCCECSTVINKQYEEWWNNRWIKPCTPGTVCKLCPSQVYSAGCKDNVCRGEYH